MKNQAEKAEAEAKSKPKRATKKLPTEVGNSSKNEVKNSIQTLTIIGQIEGHYTLTENQKATKYEQIIPILTTLEQNDEVGGILIILNTMGGDVEAGLAIGELIASMKKPTVSLILGGSHSIGVPIAVSTDYSFIVPSATMTIHPVRVNGLVVGAPQTYNYFSDMQTRIIDFICRNSSADAEDIRSLMLRPDMLATDVGTVLDGEQAVAHGLINEVGGLSDALDKLRKLMK